MEIMGYAAEKGGREEFYNKADIAAAMRLWSGIGYNEKVELPDGVVLELLDAGHILGSAMARLSRKGRSIVFTGDLGGGNSPLLPPTQEVAGATYVVMEGTYGDKMRQDSNRREELENVIEDTAARGGTLLIPAFSTERTQDLMYEIRNLMVEKRIPSIPVFVDSPLAQKITAIFSEYLPEFDFQFPELRFVEGVDASRKVHETPSPKIILAGSGMSSGGRVVGHERVVLPDPKSTLLIVGYQAAGTLGRRLIEGAKTLKIYKETVPVRAKVVALYGYSAHRDSESLLEFANHVAESAEEIFVVHAEPAASAFLVQRIRDYLGVKATAPEAGGKVTLKF